jgi:hypothetical protein
MVRSNIDNFFSFGRGGGMEASSEDGCGLFSDPILKLLWMYWVKACKLSSVMTFKSLIENEEETVQKKSAG